jgi:hypothetical protein
MHNAYHLTIVLALSAQLLSGCGDCNDLELPHAVTITAGTGTPVAPAGGAIADGTYALTSMADYSSAGSAVGETIADIFRFSGTTIDRLELLADGRVVRGTGTYTIAGTGLSYSLHCGSARETGAHSFTAAPTTLTFSDSTGSKSFVSTYNKM